MSETRPSIPASKRVVEPSAHLGDHRTASAPSPSHPLGGGVGRPSKSPASSSTRLLIYFQARLTISNHEADQLRLHRWPKAALPVMSSPHKRDRPPKERRRLSEIAGRRGRIRRGSKRVQIANSSLLRSRQTATTRRLSRWHPTPPS